MRFIFFILLAVSACAQSVGDFSIPYKANSTGPQTLKSWAKANYTLWGTDGSGNPQSITIGSGLSLASGVLTSSGGGGVGTGTVTSVALTMPNIFSVTGSPITASGTLAASLATQSANAVFAGPTTGTAAAPTFRALVAADIPDLSGTYQPLIGTGTLALSKLATDPLARANHTGTQAWSTITSTPTTLAGYGITDSITAALAASTYQPLIGTGTLALSKLATDPLARANHTGTQAWSTITSTPTTLAGYGITDSITAALAASTYQPLASILTSLSGLSNASGVLTNNGSGALNYTGTSAGGNAGADSGKLAKFDADGRLSANGFNFSGGGYSGFADSTGLHVISDTTAEELYLKPAYFLFGTPTSGALFLYPPATSNTWQIYLPAADGTLITTGNLEAINSTSVAIGVGSIELGHASDTTLARSSAGNITVEGQAIYRAGGSFTGMPVEHVISASNTTDDLTTGTAKETFRMPHGMNLTSVRINCSTAPTGSVIIVDVKEGGTTIFSTKPQIATSAKTSVGGAVPGTLSDTSLADDAEITINLDQIGSTIAGKGLKVTLIGTR